jgi:hypothetical protein
MEAGVHSIWISEQLEELGHEVIVANARELRAISHSDRKGDQVDAEKLARYARLDPEILRPISHRSVEQQQALILIRARDLLVRLRTASVNALDWPDPEPTQSYLDVELAGAAAPGATLDLYLSAGSPYQDPLELAASRAVEDNQADVLSLSWGSESAVSFLISF